MSAMRKNIMNWSGMRSSDADIADEQPGMQRTCASQWNGDIGAAPDKDVSGSCRGVRGR